MSGCSFHDIDGNKMFENDFGLFISSGEIKYGMLCGKRVMTKHGSLLNFSEAYKLNDENLSKKQLEYKKLIQIKYDEYYAEKEAKKNLPRIAAKDLEIGQAYISLNKTIYLYCGHGTVSYDFYKTKLQRTGYIYIKIGSCVFTDINNVIAGKEYIRKYLLADMFFCRSILIPIVCKSRKKFIAKSNYYSPIIKKDFEYSYCDNYSDWPTKWRKKCNNKLLKFSID